MSGGGDPRRRLLEWYAAALAAVDGRAAVRRRLEAAPPPVPCHVVAVGKAAVAMARGALDAVEGGIERGLVVTRHGYGAPFEDARIELSEAGHPVPDAASLEAGARLLAFIDGLPADRPLLFLLSGGASALVEALPEGADLAFLERLNRWLLASGLDIARMNRVRKAVSRIKGGRLAGRLHGQPVTQLLISDVPGDDPAVIGSGPLVPDPAAGTPLPAGVPAWAAAVAARCPPPPPSDDRVYRAIATRIVARNADALDAVAAAAADCPIHRHPEPLAGEAAEAGRRLAEAVLAGPPGLHLWGGETTVTLPPAPGRGGRSQTLALAAAQRLAGRPDVFLLAAGTDGSDGPTEDAGALVDGGTVGRGEREGLSAVCCLEGADAGTFLEASGDLIQTGPTGTNVMDVVLALNTE